MPSTTRSSSGESIDGELDPTVLALGMGEQRILVGDTVQTRRNDRLTGVENRAQWIVRGIRDDGITLASVSDSGELRRESRVCARAPAARLRVDGAWRPGRDGRCVRGRAGCGRGGPVRRPHSRASPNIAIVVARTDADAIAQCRRDDAARDDRADDAGCDARGSGGDAAGGASAGAPGFRALDHTELVAFARRALALIARSGTCACSLVGILRV